MSTKTTIKRIALVAVSALGLGSLSVVAANAATYTDSFGVDKSSITVVAGGTNASAVTAGAIFKATLGNDGTDTNWTLATGETLTASVVAVPAGNASTAKSLVSNAADLAIAFGTVGTDNGNPYGSAFSASSSAGASASASAAIGAGETMQKASAATAALTNSIYLQVKPASGKNDVIDNGTYTIRVRLTSNNGALVVQDSLLKVTFVSSAASSGAVLTVATAGAYSATETVTAYSATKYIKVTLTDANGGRLVSEATAGTSARPSVTVDLVDKDGTLLVGASGNFTATDDATNDSDYGYAATAATGYSSAADTNVAANFNGVYGVDVASTSALPTTAVGTTNKIRARYGASSASAAITILNSVSGTAGTPVITAENLSLDSASPSWYVPVSTKAINVATTGTAGAAYSYTVTWTYTATGDQSPKTATPTIVYADASGKIAFTVTNANPVDGATAAISFAGWNGAQPATQTIYWKKSAATTVTVSLNGAYVATGSTNKFVATVTDYFGAPVAGVVLQPSIVSGSANYSATAVFASVVTDAKGEASLSVTDAKAVAKDTETVKFATIDSSAISGTSTITYAAAAPAPTAITTFVNVDGSKTAAADIVTANPTVVYVNGVSSKFPVQIARDINKAVTRANTSDHLAVLIKTGAAGAAVTATSTTGYVLNASRLQKSTYTQYADSDGYAVFTIGSNKTGKNVVTFTSGTATSSVTFATSTTLVNARFLTLTSANGEVTATVTDRYGNGVSGASITISTTAGTLGNGQKSTTYTTDAVGTVTVIPVISGDATITAEANDTADYASLAGYVGTTKVESTLAAGVDTATLAFVGTSVSSSDSVDAANEATDAANAATDAANAAAEAADAATAAAQDAQAAVAALATSVASLIAGIKAQITTLTNLVIKIQKKVKA